MAAPSGPGISSSITYDQLNRKTQETVTYGTITKTYSYSYDANGNKQTFTSPEGKTYNYTHNKNNQLTDITADNKTITLEHQWIRQTKTTLPNNITTSYSYNANNWLAAIETRQNSSTLSKQQNSFDKTGNITTKTTEQQTISYSYDPLYQLTQAGAESFSYDNNGNRADSTADANNRVTATATATYSYDANGNTTGKTENGQTTTYSYDAANRLTQVTLPNGSSVSYAYDPFNRRIKKQTPTETTYYLYADEGLIGEYSETGTPKKTYAWLPDSTWGTNPISQAENGITYYYLNDHLGTPQKLVDENGTVVWAASYDAFGKATVTTGTVSNNLRFPGQYYDEETGNHYNWNRYYDPSTGRYTQEDPIGLKGKDYNFYRYVQGNSVNWTDPWGLLAMGLNLGGAVEGGLGLGLAGGVQGAVGFGGFYSAKNGFSTGAFATLGAFVAGLQDIRKDKSFPRQECEVNSALGLYGGGGAGVWLSNAAKINDLEGPFQTYSINAAFFLRALTVQFSIGKNSEGKTIWMINYAGPMGVPTGGGLGASISAYGTNTWTTK